MFNNLWKNLCAMRSEAKNNRPDQTSQTAGGLNLISQIHKVEAT